MIRIATDVGGTFTDLLAIDEESGRVMQAKALTTPADPAQGVLNALVQAGLEGEVLAQAGFFVHGGTTVINRSSSERACAPPSSPPQASGTCC